MSDLSSKVLDHIVHLTPPGTLELASKQFRELGFTVITGGTHADGLTANALVILPDSTYLELIEFTHPVSHYPPGSPDYLGRTQHQWANKPPGWVAYAFAGAPTASPTLSEILNERLSAVRSSTKYKAPVQGGRTRPDGVKLEWEIIAPVGWAAREDGMGRPFYCGDITPREHRVPSESAHRHHENTTRSVAYLRVLSKRSTFDEDSATFNAITGHQATLVSEYEHTWDLDAPSAPDYEASTSPRLVLAAAEVGNEEEETFVRDNGLGLFEVGFRVQEGGGSKKYRTPYGRLAWVV